VSGLPDKIVALHRALETAGIPHAFGGALALAWCTQRARGTVDIDLNVFVGQDQTEAVVHALPRGVTRKASEIAALKRDGQARLWWDETPIDVFLNTTDYHDQIAGRTRQEPFLGDELPFLSCTDLAVFKVFFNRTKDWADVEEMTAAGSLDKEKVLGVLVQYLGPADDRIQKLRELE
jgi:hypothetical protein